MLSDSEIMLHLEMIRPQLAADHPLMVWRSAFDSETLEIDSEQEEVQLVARSITRYAIQERGEPYSDALALIMFSYSPTLDGLDEDLRQSYLEGSFERLVELGDMAMEPVLALWVADAALTRARGLRAGYAGEMQMLACRMGCRLSEPMPSIVMAFVTRFLYLESQALSVDNYVASGVLGFVNHLRALTSGEYEAMLVGLECQSIATKALFDADQGRREGVKYYADTLKAKVAVFVDSVSSDTAVDELELDVPWDPSDLAGGLGILADAQLLADMPSSALETLEIALEMDPYDGAAQDLEVLRRVFGLVYPERFIR
jgi:hypothetical protein